MFRIQPMMPMKQYAMQAKAPVRMGNVIDDDDELSSFDRREAAMESILTRLRVELSGAPSEEVHFKSELSKMSVDEIRVLIAAQMKVDEFPDFYEVAVLLELGQPKLKPDMPSDQVEKLKRLCNKVYAADDNLRVQFPATRSALQMVGLPELADILPKRTPRRPSAK